MPDLKRAVVRTVKPRVSAATWERLRSMAQRLPRPPQRYRAMSLDELGRTFGTDKVTLHSYGAQYERHLGQLRDTSFALFEIGIGGYSRVGEGGASLRTWRAYFQKADIVGLDIQDKSFVDGERLTTYQGSQVDDDVLRLIEKQHGPFTVIIDDGSHRPQHIRETFALLYPRLAEEGIYVIEDTQTSYWPRFGGSVDRQAPHTTMALVKDLVDGLNHVEFAEPGYCATYTDLHVSAVHCYHNLVFIQKGRNDEPSTIPMERRFRKGRSS